MANPTLTAKPGSYVAAALFVSFLGLIVAGAILEASFGWLIYLVGLAAIVAGFSTKEDVVAVGGIMLLNLLVILDIFMGVGVLG